MEFYGFKIDFWTIWGLIGQFFFLLSFIVQWYRSEKRKRSYLPIDFWYLRLFASGWLIVYVIVRRDIVFLVALILQVLIYLRNLQIIHKNPEQNMENI